MSTPDPHTEAADAVHEGRPVAAQYVRGARPGKRILWLLVISGGAAAILLIGMWFVSNSGFAAQNPNAAEQAVDAAAFSAGADFPAADAPTTATGEPANPPTSEAPNVNAPTVSVDPST
ncbi:MAG: hypothetical protein Q8S03_04675 [Brevundimonas sp.]|uniref:hypothetical protein n=1 Tax=Brevundimonas sp. TaxID=1871086 RepID=UPI002734136B|nr:hypothetical protein [Brevundimonas sp.]MDP3403963.1 hypothetical protein [Brevundimonas sp.]